MTVELIDHMGSDYSVVVAARVSTGGDMVRQGVLEGPTVGISAGDSGLISFLMANRHGTPFEHNAFTFRIEAPIFVWREFMRHRVFSFNEESGRYKQLDPVFYVPAPDRNLVQVGKAGQYTFEPGTESQHLHMAADLKDANYAAYDAYEQALTDGVAREVARMCLPVNIYSSAYVTGNLRAWMGFLSLRTKRDDSTFPSFPQREIEMCAEQIEMHIERLFPVSMGAFSRFGRVSP
jgi:thymidylate synthase (FAD)